MLKSQSMTTHLLHKCPQVTAFKEVLEKAGIPVSVRTTRGLDAAAACGQLRNQFQKAQLQDPQPLR